MPGAQGRRRARAVAAGHESYSQPGLYLEGHAWNGSTERDSIS